MYLKIMQNPRPFCQAFTLVELLTVVCIAMLMMGLSLPAIGALSKSSKLNTASRQVSNLLSLARTEAITKRTLTRFVVATEWPDQPDGSYRKMSIWKQDGSTGMWVQISKWEEIPEGVVFDFDADTNPYGSAKANNVLNVGGANSDQVTVKGKSVAAQYAEFLPTGAARLTANTVIPEVWLGLTPGSFTGGSIVSTVEKGSNGAGNWSKLSVSSLTGRQKITRP